MGKLFGTNGVRGVANAELSAELALRLARAVGTWMPAGGLVAVARDARTSGPMLEAAVCAGLASTGLQVVRLGICSTPAAQYWVKTHQGAAGGVIITASHNPPEYNGIKLVAPDGTETSREEEDAVETFYFAEKFRAPAWNQLRPIHTDDSANADYMRGILRLVDTAATRRRKLKVVLDAGGGPGVLATLPLLKELGCQVTTVFEDLDGQFTGRKSEPVEENLAKLRETVVKAGADLGIAHDGDADRAIFVDEKGAWVSGDASLALLARSELKRKGPGLVVTPVSTSSLLEEVVQAAGGNVATTAVGSPIVAREMMRRKAVYGGEENGGLIFPDHQYCRDGAMSAAKMVELLSKERTPLSALVAGLPQYHVTKIKFPVTAQRKDAVLTEFRAWVTREYKQAKIDATDGLKIYTDGGWVLVRPSGTEPIFRIFVESKNKDWSQSTARRFLEEGQRIAKAG